MEHSRKTHRSGSMRCSCKECGTYMVHQEKGFGRCVCPECRNECTDCLGTNTVISKEDLKALKGDPIFEMEILERIKERENDDQY